jgi:hypothetical protein
MGSGLFPAFQASADVGAGWDTLLDDWGTASVDESYTENLLVTGGTGSGTLILDVALMVQGSEFGIETGGDLAASVDGINVSRVLNTIYPGWMCYYGGEDCFWQPDVPAQYIAIPFTFGVPFSFSEEFTLSAQANDDGSTLMSGGMATSLFSVLDPNGNVVSAQIADPPDAPEPASLLLCAGLLGLGAAGQYIRRCRVSRQRRRAA